MCATAAAGMASADESKTYLELLILGGLDGSILGELLDDLDGLVESGLDGHVCWLGVETLLCKMCERSRCNVDMA